MMMMMPSSSTNVFENIVGKLNKGMCVWDGRWSVGGVGGVSESDMRGDGDDLLVSLRILWFGTGPLCFSVAVNGAVVMRCKLVDVGSVDLGVMVLGLDSSFGDCFCLELGGVEE